MMRSRFEWKQRRWVLWIYGVVFMLWCNFCWWFLEFMFFFGAKGDDSPFDKKQIRCPTPKMSDFLSERKLESG